MALVLILSYIADWLVLAVLAAASAVMGRVTPIHRPFSLSDENISFPFTAYETVPTFLLVVASIASPLVIIAAVSLILVPGSTVPKGTPRALVWKRKLWELHVGWLGLALSLSLAWFITNGMKNMFGKPRPDLVSRCEPDLANLTQYIVGGIAGAPWNAELVSSAICKSGDKSRLDDGFRSYPSGHASSSAAGLVYLSLFLASKFAVTIPFAALAGAPIEAASFSAFPSRLRPEPDSYRSPNAEDAPSGGGADGGITAHKATVMAVRRQAAAPPLYLLVLVLVPPATAVFIAASRWFDFRHHGFDILFGFVIGTTTAIFSFRYYHLPVSRGAGWGWGPRSKDKAFWAGVGSYSYATRSAKGIDHKARDEEMMPCPVAGGKARAGRATTRVGGSSA